MALILMAAVSALDRNHWGMELNSIPLSMWNRSQQRIDTDTTYEDPTRDAWRPWADELL